MNEDNWEGVARTINRRMEFLGINQTLLIERSRVSKAVIRELQYNTVNRHRSPRTLEAISTALELAPTHLDAVLHYRKPPPIPPTRTQPPTPHPAHDQLTLRDITELELDSRKLRHLQHRLELYADNLADLADLLTEAEAHLGITRDTP
ncbi:hypothetical protein [Actinokineospora inagensis]|uniref:hypothetical protein n=1 Tax=Actinokineospora inagensis TaxID=103730 RepID=UPI000410259C|nr:hypothetical protein [Actinokineospora inagensis]